MKLKILALLFLLWPFTLHAQTWQVGFRTLGVWEDEPAVRVDINIWYPSLRKPRDLDYSPWVFSAALNGKPAPGRFPLLLLSHDTPGDRFSHHSLASSLAANGFYVVAPNHGGDCMNNMDDLFTWQQLHRRTGELAKAIDLVLAEKDLADNINAAAIGMIGFGSGATSALLMGGALPSCTNWGAYCPKAGSHDVYCSPWAVERMINMCSNFPLTKSLADTRIKAIAAIAPGYGMLFDAQSFRHFHPALLLVAAGRSLFNRNRLHCEPIARLLGKKARFLNLPDADTGALMSACPPALNAEVPELCNSVTPEMRAQIHGELQDTLLSFFRHYLVKEGNLPFIPAPPDLTPEPPGAKQMDPPPPTPKTRKQRRQLSQSGKVAHSC